MKIFSKATGLLFGIIITSVSIVGAQSTGTLIDRMYDNDLTIYQTPEAFRLNQYVTRGEVAKFLNQYATTLQLEKNTPLSKCQFTDIEEYDITLIPHIIEACEYGLVKGFEGQYFPNSFITEAEALTIVIRSILGVQDETTDPWRTLTHQKAENLGIITQVGVEALDVSAQRGTIGKRLYTVANGYVPKAQGKNSSDIYTTTVSSGGVTVTLFDGTQSYVVTENSQESGYADSTISPNTQYAALTETGSTKPYVSFYDVTTNQIQGKVQGTFKSWTQNGLARIKTCYQVLGTCEVRTSISAQTPWIFPEVRAQSGKLGLVCQPTNPAQSNTSKQLSITLDGVLYPIQQGAICSGIQIQNFSMYAIPEEALVAAITISSGQTSYFYVLQSGDNYHIYSSGPTDETNSTEDYEYAVVKTITVE